MKVLIVLNNLRVANGVAATIMNQYDSLLNNGCDVDFMEFINYGSPYKSRIKGDIITIKKNSNYYIKIFKLIKSKRYDIIHINQMNLQTVFLTIIAHILDIKCIVYHSHNTRIPGNLKKIILQKLCNLVYMSFANHYLSCSEQAGKDVFGKKQFTVMKNSIDVNQFRFNIEKRVALRKYLSISDETFVIGTVCRYAKQKNPLFMIEIISEVIKIRPNTIFLWVGSAPNNEDSIIKEMYSKVKMLNIEQNMRWVGSKDDTHNWYSVMDVFLMPSLWEGLGITYLEAQANGLPTFASDIVPVETKITNLIHYLSLSKTAIEWANCLCNYSIRENIQSNFFDDFHKKGYDLNDSGNDLYNIYCNFISIHGSNHVK